MADIPFLGCKISLISKSDIRYEGILYCVDPKESTISLSKVRSYGTETRGDPANFVPPKNDVYDVIIFRASDVKDLRVDAQEPPVLSDPAIISARQSSTSTSIKIGPPQPSAQQQAAQQQPTQQPPVQRRPPQQQQQQQQPREQRSAQQQHHQQTAHQPPTHQHPRQKRVGHSGDVNDHRREDTRPPRVDRRGPPPPGNRYHMNSRNGPPMRGNGRRRSTERNGTHDRRMPRKAPLKYQGEFDFDEANKIFLELESKLDNMKISDGNRKADAQADRDTSKSPEEGSESGSDNDKDKGSDYEKGSDFYDKSKSFFDNISCEAKEQGRVGRPDWRKERQTNAETFGISANYRRGGYRRRPFNPNGMHRRRDPPLQTGPKQRV